MSDLVHKIAGGITPKGTIYLRELSEQGKLLRKRVVKKNMQFDAKMSDKNADKCSQVLQTDWSKQGEQVLHLVPKKVGAIKGFFLKLMGADLKKGADGKFLTQPEAVPILRTKNPDMLYDGYVKMVQDKTGFLDNALDSEMCNLKTLLNCRKV